MSAFGPLRVATVDVAHALSDLDCARSEWPPYAGAWILACRSGRPLGIVEIALTGTQIPAAKLEREIRHQLGEAWTREAPLDLRSLPRASVVVPTNLSRPTQLLRCIECIQALDYPEFEVIVVDNRPHGSKPVEIAGVRVIREPRPGASAARNRGFAEATGDIIAYTDDDAEVDSRWLRALGEFFVRQPDVAAVTGLVVPRELETPAQIWFEQSGRSPNRGFVPLTFERVGQFRVRRHAIEDGSERLQSIYATGELSLGGNMAIRKTVLEETGGFDEALGPGTATYAGEDPAIVIQLLTKGYRLAFEPSAIVHHPHRATLADLQRQLHGFGVGFTAMLTSIVLSNPRHLVGLAAAGPQWLRSRQGHQNCSIDAGRTLDYPRPLARAEFTGMLAGPFAYLHSRWMQQRWTL